MNVTISGGLGFIGSRLAKRYAERGDSITILDNVHPQIHADADSAVREMAPYARIVVGDVCDRAKWREVLRGADVVFHMAAETGTGQSMNEVVRYCEVNVCGTAILAEELAGTGVRKVFLPSSRAVYGEGAYRCSDHGVVSGRARSDADLKVGRFAVLCPRCDKVAEPIATPEWLPTSPVSIYASTKVAQEDIVRQRCAALGIESRIARYQNVYGPGQSLNNPYTGVLAIFARQIDEGATLNIYEDGAIARDFVYIDDVVNATARLVALDDAPSVTLNVGTGRATTLAQIVRSFERAFGREVSFRVSGDFRTGDIRHACADTCLMERTLGEEAFVEIDRGISQLQRWLQGV